MSVTSTADGIGAAEPDLPISDASSEEILASLDFTIPRTAVSSGYGIALALLATGLTLIPLIYLAMLGFFGYLVGWHTYQVFATLEDGPFFVFHFPMAFLGGLLLLFLIKPVFFRRRTRSGQVLTLTESAEPLLFAYVRKLCAATGSKPPARIEVDCDPNAHARLRRGVLSIFGGDLVLRIGLPLAAELSLSQFTGVLAHEFGHFNQRHGMSGSYLIRRLMVFFAKIVFQRDKLDERLARLRLSSNVLRQGLYWLLLVPVEAARGVLWLMQLVGELLTCSVLRRMEYDADRMEALVAGTGDFIRTSHSLVFLQIAATMSRADLMETWEARRLADDLPGLIVLNSRHLEKTRGELLQRLTRQKTRWLDTHPSHDDRIRHVQALGAGGLLCLNARAERLFSNFGDLCLRATMAFYQSQLGTKVSEAQLITAPALAEERFGQRDAYRALRRFMRGHIVLIQPVFPLPDADVPLENPADATDALRAARISMLRAADQLGAGAKRVQKDVVVMAAARAKMSLSGIFNRSPQAARISAVATRTLRLTEKPHEQTMKRYQPFAVATQARLTTALRLLLSDSVTLPRAGGGENYVAVRRARASTLIGVCRALEAFVPRINRLADLAVSVQVLMSTYSPRKPHPPLVRQILTAVEQAADILRSAWSELAVIPFPFPHATAGISVGGVMVPRFPAPRDAADTHACAVTAINAFSLLVVRTLAELSQQAEEVEKAANFDAMPEAPDPLDDKLEGPRRGSEWRYWISYSVRALAGTAMLSALVWFSVNPPVIPAMPWDDYAPREGYQPNAFHVPFTPPPVPMRYPTSVPGRGHGPQPALPHRPGMPRPPGAPHRNNWNPFQPSRGTPGYPGGGGGAPGHWGGGGAPGHSGGGGGHH